MSGRAVAGAAVAAAALAILAVGSLAPWRAADESRALIRLSWRAASERIEACRPLTPEEIARMPVHMRRPEVCETHAVPYLLVVGVDGRTVVVDTLAGAGARADRPVVVFREIAVRPGERAIDVRFEPIAVAEEHGPEHEEEEGEHRDDERIAALRLVERVRLAPRDVALVMLEAERRELSLVAPGRS